MTFEYLSAIDLEKRIRELYYKSSKKFEVIFVTPYDYYKGSIIRYMFCYIFIDR